MSRFLPMHSSAFENGHVLFVGVNHCGEVDGGE